MDTRGTLAIDLMFATFMILIMVGTMSFLALDRFNMVDESQDLVEARSLADNIAGALNQAYAGGDGHLIEINMPAQINHDNNYIVYVNSSGVLVRSEGRRGFAYSIPEKISASITSLKSSTVTMFPSKKYIFINKKDGNGENWIVIEEDK
jgi:hypothetical protein